MGGEGGERSGVTIQRGERFLLVGAERLAAESGAGTGQGEPGQGVPHLGRNAPAASGPAFQLGEEFITLASPLRRRGGVAAGGGDFGERVVVLPGFLEAEGFVDLPGLVGVALGGVEVAEQEVDPGELAQRIGFIRLVLLGLPDPQAFLHGAAGFLEVPPGGGLVAPLTCRFAFELADDADVLRGGPRPGWSFNSMASSRDFSYQARASARRPAFCSATPRRL